MCIPRTSASAKLSLEVETSILLVLSHNFGSFPKFWFFWVLVSFDVPCGDYLIHPWFIDVVFDRCPAESIAIRINRNQKT